MTLIFPMAGLSSRFARAGYTLPKYMLDLKGQSVFSHVLKGFERYFEAWDFLFIYRNLKDTTSFIQKECERLNLKRFKAVELERETLGQAHTVFLGLQKARIKDSEPLLIFNIDTFRPHFSLPQGLNLDAIDGYLEVFRGTGEQWSFVKTLPDSDKVVQTAEKERISDLASTGLYYFKQTSDFKGVFEHFFQSGTTFKNEFYIAPMYNALIAQNKDIRAFEVPLKDIVFCGTPSEYETLLKQDAFQYCLK